MKSDRKELQKEQEIIMRIWVKVFDDNAHMLNSETIEDYSDETRTHKVFNALQEACNRLDLGKPIWLDSNIKEFKRLAKTRFYQDNFVEEIEFQFLELHVIEEDQKYLRLYKFHELKVKNTTKAKKYAILNIQENLRNNLSGDETWGGF